MKKAKMIGKKTLSVFLAVLMVLTAWVWVAPQKASAAAGSNGKYSVKITWEVLEAGNFEADYNNKSEVNDSVGMTIYYALDNGRGSSGTHKVDLKSEVKTKEPKTSVYELDGFPTEFYASANDDRFYAFGITGQTKIQFTKIEVKGADASSYKTLWSGIGFLNTTNQHKCITINATESTGNDSKNGYVTDTSKTWTYPYVPSGNTVYAETSVAAIGIPPLGDKKDTTISTRSIQYYALDYYGARYEPTSYSVSGVSGLTTGTGWSCGSAYKIEAKDGTTKSTTGVSQTATVTMNWNNGTSTTGQKADTTATFQVYNPRYKVTYNGNGGTLGTGYTYGYYGRPINHSTSTATTNNVAGLDAELFPSTGIREGYTFDGIYTTATGGSKISATQTIGADMPYYAQWVKNNYTATFYGTKANEAGSGTVEYIIDTLTVPFETVPTAPTTVEGYSLGDYDYTFAGWDKEISAIGVNGAEYRATYTSAFVPAVYTEVNEIVAEANAIINGENYEGIYSEESRNALEAVVNSVNYNFGRTNQETVDGYVPLIRTAIDGLGRQKYSVLFIDGVDNSVIELRYPVYYGDAITLPGAPKRGFTTTDHYVFREWTTSEVTDNINFVEKNMIIIANYNKVAHTFTETSLPSNCTTQAGVLHKCSCGYEYIEYAGSVGTEHNLETEFTVDIAPTCTTVGSKSHHCTRCSYRADITEIPALDHDFTDGYQGVVINPGCENDGAEVSECQRCGYDKYNLLPQNGHVWVEKVIAPTCTSSGYTVKTCSNCYDEDIVSFTDPIAHTYTENEDEYIAPTCTGLGRKVYYCSCGAQKVETVGAIGHIWDTTPTVDFEATCTTKGQQSIHCSVCDVINSESIEEIPANDHTWGAEVCEQNESCGVKGLYIKACEVCGENSSRIVDARTHNYSEEVVLPTCTTKGYTKKTCDICGDVIYTNETAALNHAWTSTTVNATCEHSAYIEHVCGNDSTHNYIEYVNGSTVELHTWTQIDRKDADCENDGYIDYECSVCNKATKREILPKLGHKYGEWDKTTDPATNDKDGTWTRKCQNANCTKEETLIIPKGGHNLVEISRTAAKCNEKGSVTYGCTAHTNCPITVTEVLDYAQHTIAQGVTREASCTTTGILEVYCSYCGKVFSTTETPKTAHTFSTTDVDATCTTDGYKLYECTCGFSYREYDADKKATGHTYVGEVTTAAGCETTGVKTYACACGDSFTDVIPATGHNYTQDGDATEVTCTTPSTAVYKCNCGDTYTKFISGTTDHSWGNWTVVSNATANERGVEIRTCACGAVEYKTTPPTGGHVFKKNGEQAATCAAEGYINWKCETHANCEANYTETLEKLPHTQEITYTAPSCIAEGSSKVICSECNAEILNFTVPATGIHDFSGEGVKSDATCADEGTMTYTCKTEGCNATKVEKIPAKGHDLTTTVADATCTAKGSVVTTCSRCNYTSSTELAIKGHIWNSGEETTKATCTDAGEKTYTCSVCNETKTETIKALGHDWGKWEVTPSTNGNPGSVSRICSVCKESESIEIPAGGHELVVDTENSTPASCKAEGKTIYICKNHSDCGITITVDTPKTQHTIATEIKEATCTADGYIKTYCSVCNKELSKEATKKIAHVFEAQTAVAPTCTTSGYTPYKCSCGDSYNEYDESKPANGHTLVEGTSTATCEKGGKMTLKCENCTYSTTVNVPALGHNYVKVSNVDATCAVAATETYTCEHANCNSTYTISVGEKSTTHTWGDWTVKESADQNSIGYQTRTCKVCGQLEVAKIDATGEHKFIDGDVVEGAASKVATCTEDGYETRRCSVHDNCPETAIVAIPATGHTEEIIAAVDATCTTPGSTTGVKCSTCNTVLEKVVELPALGHAWNSGKVTNATCKEEGKIEYTCTRTGCNATHTATIPTNANAHQYETKVVKATCTSVGSVVTKCKLCGNTTTNETLAQLQHTWDSGSETKAATCLGAGVKTYECNDCPATKTEDIPALGHSWSEWIETKASTNSDKGEMKRSCERDGCTASETVEIPAGGHKLEVTSKTDAKCTAPGSVTYTCKANHTGGVKCGITVTVELAQLQHNMVTTVTEVTCDNPGKTITKCATCDTQTSETIILATGHAWNEGVIEKGNEATCTKEGTMTFTCAHNADHKCTKQIAKTQHVYVEDGKVAPTCVDSGYTKYKCSNKECTSAYIVVTAAAKGHTFNTVVSSTANCTEGGVMTLKCACGKTMETQVPALGHDYQFSVATMATCAEAATETFKCSRCADSYTVSVGSKTNNHDWNDWVIVKATNTSLGYQTRTCKACDKLEFEIIPATGEHKFDTETNDKKAETCTEGGYIVYACSTHDDCGLTSKVTIPAKGHTEQLMYSAPSCTKEGSTSIYCDVCKTTLSSKTIDKLDHVFEVESIKNATCKAEGLISFKCTCGATKTQTIAVDSTAHQLKTNVDLATCKEAGSVTVICENGCTYTEETAIPKLQHSWGEWKVTTASTNSTDGEMTRYCGSGCSETVEIPAGGHAFGDTPDSTTPASCTAEGTATYNCTAHTNCGVTITVKTEKLQHTLVTDSKASNCTESGYVKVYCSECKKEYSNMTFGKLAHDYTVVVEKFDATCTTAGHTILKCVNCDAKYDRFDAQPNGHDFDESIEENVKTVPATCDIHGSKTVKCKTCDATNVTVIPATGHEYKDEKAIVETKPTCTKMGYTTYTCDICRSSYTTNFVNPTGHKYTSVVTAPTCTASGYTTYTCTCGESYISNPVSPTGHNFDEKIEGNVTIVSADCEADGLKTVKCNNCDATNVTVLPATGHDYDVNNDGKINLDDAEMIDGEFVYVCQNAGCSHKIKAEDDTDSYVVSFFDGNGDLLKTQVVISGAGATAPAETPVKDADGNYHYTFSGWDRDFGKIDKDLDVYATFEKEAHYGGEAVCYAKAVCDKCGVGYGEFDATKHIIVTKSKSATCEADGWIEYYCSVEICGYHYSTGNYLKKETIGASGHVYGKWTIVQNGTCEIPQIQQRRCVNVDCNKIDEKRTQSTHTWMIEPKINPTCSSVGYTEFKYCLTCNLQIDRVEIPKTDHKDLDGNGYCDYCGTSKGTPKCNCMCHSTGIMKLFYGIVKFFWKLTKSSRSCSCGAVHY